MHKFRGAIDELKALVTDTGLKGAWTQVQNGWQFRTADDGILNWFEGTGTLLVQGKDPGKQRLSDSLAASEGEAPNRAAPDRPPDLRVFVVHGHDATAREQLELLLHRLDLDPFVLANTGGDGLTLIEALEREFTGPTAVRFGIVLLTPDDMGYARAEDPARAEPRARQNVVLEMGMLISALGRGSVAILKKGHVEVPSDAAGIIYLGFNDHVREALPRLVDRLRRAGFEISPEAITRASA